MGKGAKKKTKWISLSLVDSTTKQTSDKEESSKPNSTKSYKSILSNSISTTEKERPPHREPINQFSENSSFVRRRRYPPSHGFNQENTNNETYVGNSRRNFHGRRPYYSSSRLRTERDSGRNDENEVKKNYADDEYTRISTPRQDVLFKKGYLSRPKKFLQLQEQAPMPVQIASPSCDDSSLAGTSTEESVISDSMSPEQVYTPNGTDYVPYCGYIDENGVFVMNPGYDGYNGYYPTSQMMMYPVQWPYNEFGNYEYYPNDCKEHCDNNFEKDEKSEDCSKVDEAVITSELTQSDEKSGTNNDDETETNVLINGEEKLDNVEKSTEKDEAINSAEVQPYYTPYYYPGYVYRQYPYVPYYDNNFMMNNESFVRQSKYRKKKRRFRPTSSNGTTTTTDYSGEDSSDDHRHLESEFPIKSTLNADVQEFLPSSKLSSLSSSSSSEQHPLENSSEPSISIISDTNIKESTPQIDSTTEKTIESSSITASCSIETASQIASLTAKDNLTSSVSNSNVLKSPPQTKNVHQTSVLSKKQLIESTKSITEQNIDLAKHDVAYKNANNSLSNEWTVVCKGKHIVHSPTGEESETNTTPAAVMTKEQTESQAMPPPNASSQVQEVKPAVEVMVEPITKTQAKNKKNKIKSKKSRKTKIGQVQNGFQVIEPDFSAKETSEEPAEEAEDSEYINEENEILENIEDYLGPDDLEQIRCNSIEMIENAEETDDELKTDEIYDHLHLNENILINSELMENFDAKIEPQEVVFENIVIEENIVLKHVTEFLPVEDIEPEIMQNVIELHDHFIEPNYEVREIEIEILEKVNIETEIRQEVDKPKIRQDIEPEIRQNDDINQDQIIQPEIRQLEAIKPEIIRVDATEIEKVVEPEIMQMELVKSEIEEAEMVEPGSMQTGLEPEIKHEEAIDIVIKQLKFEELEMHPTEVNEPEMRPTKVDEPEMRPLEVIEFAITQQTVDEPELKSVLKIDPEIKQNKALDPEIKPVEIVDPEILPTEVAEVETIQAEALENNVLEIYEPEIRQNKVLHNVKPVKILESEIIPVEVTEPEIRQNEVIEQDEILEPEIKLDASEHEIRQIEVIKPKMGLVEDIEPIIIKQNIKAEVIKLDELIEPEIRQENSVIESEMRQETINEPKVLSKITTVEPKILLDNVKSNEIVMQLETSSQEKAAAEVLKCLSENKIQPEVLQDEVIETVIVPVVISKQETTRKISEVDFSPEKEIFEPEILPTVYEIIELPRINEEPILSYPLEAIQEEDEEKEGENPSSIIKDVEQPEVHVSEAVSKWLQTNLETKNLHDLFKIPDDPMLLDIISKFSVPGFNNQQSDNDSLADSCDENGFDDEINENDQISLPDTDSDYMSDIQMNSKLSNELNKDNIKDSKIQRFSKMNDESLTDPINPDAIVTVKANQNSLKNKSCILM